ncbi:ribokinase [Microlunatus sp. Gsoil 973]|uniref:ribokinase n=1 Tax=Microlunatus sp. Gsoil 973 TaxID=2672569 RepID=UPI0012B4840B|nr:ribokinase [Microlunatus sp. Gsoil 973]QGN34145.1 ribokinase [Microlunatus sp. Gsoil 973]
MSRPKVCVVGAANLDLISYVPRLPTLGETLHGSTFRTGFGGKGANQAVMAAKLGAEVTMITKVGCDDFGNGTLDNFRRWGIDVGHVSRTDRASTGVAPILVDPDGNNAIVIVTGANDLLDAQDIATARPAMREAGVVICQLEIPLEVTAEAVRVARAEGTRTILNPAPASRQLPEELLRSVDVLCPNQSESALLTGLPVDTVEEAKAAAAALLARGPGATVITLGADGCVVADAAGTTHLSGVTVAAKDTTGAGDAFVGALSCLLARGDELRDAATVANRIAALSVQRPGTQTSYPDRSELPPDLAARFG